MLEKQGRCGRKGLFYPLGRGLAVGSAVCLLMAAWFRTSAAQEVPEDRPATPIRTGTPIRFDPIPWGTKLRQNAQLPWASCQMAAFSSARPPRVATLLDSSAKESWQWWKAHIAGRTFDKAHPQPKMPKHLTQINQMRTEVWISDSRGGKAKQLATLRNFAVTEMEWSPNGDFLALCGAPYDINHGRQGENDLRVLQVDHPQLWRVSGGSVARPVWHGNTLFFWRRERETRSAKDATLLAPEKWRLIKAQGRWDAPALTPLEPVTEGYPLPIAPAARAVVCQRLPAEGRENVPTGEVWDLRTGGHKGLPYWAILQGPDAVAQWSGDGDWLLVKQAVLYAPYRWVAICPRTGEQQELLPALLPWVAQHYPAPSATHGLEIDGAAWLGSRGHALLLRTHWVSARIRTDFGPPSSGSNLFLTFSRARWIVYSLDAHALHPATGLDNEAPVAPYFGGTPCVSPDGRVLLTRTSLSSEILYFRR